MNSITDVTIIDGAVPEVLEDRHEPDLVYWDVSPERFVLRAGSRAGTFLVEEGKRVTLERAPDADEKVLAAYLSTWVIVALLRQRGLLVLHASVALTSHGAIALSGVPGAGKTTTLAALLKQGCKMLADDITVLRFGNDGAVVAMPGISRLNLCEDTALRMGYDPNLLPRNPRLGIKVMAPQYDTMALEPAVLNSIYLLDRHPEKQVTSQTLRGREKFAALQECMYGQLLPDEHLGRFQLMTTLTQQITLSRITRPDSQDSLNEVVDTILHDLHFSGQEVA